MYRSHNIIGCCNTNQRFDSSENKPLMFHCPQSLYVGSDPQSGGPSSSSTTSLDKYQH